MDSPVPTVIITFHPEGDKVEMRNVERLYASRIERGCRLARTELRRIKANAALTADREKAKKLQEAADAKRSSEILADHQRIRQHLVENGRLDDLAAYDERNGLDLPVPKSSIGVADAEAAAILGDGEKDPDTTRAELRNRLLALANGNGNGNGKK